MVRYCLQGFAAMLLVAALSPAPHGQAFSQTDTGYTDDPFAESLEDLETTTVQQVPQLRFRLLEEIPVEGPLLETGPRLVDERIELPVSGGLFVLPREEGAVGRIEPQPYGGVPYQTPWTLDPAGKRRYRTLPNGWVVAERRCKRCDGGWKRKWRLRVPGNTLTAPVLHEKRLYFGAMDNRIYCLKARNGHRVWSTDVGDRSSRSLVLWAGTVGGPANPALSRRMTLLLVVPNSGAELLALEGESGTRVARLGLQPGKGRLVGVPVTLADGTIAVAHQRYAETDAVLQIYRVEPPDAPLPAPSAPETEPDLAEESS